MFISMTGYSEDAVDAVTVGKELNVILMDDSDIDAAVNYGFLRVLTAKLRAAVEEGVILYPFLSTNGHPVDEAGLDKTKRELILLGDGPILLKNLGPLAERALKEERIDVAVRCVVTHGLVGSPRVANALSSIVPDGTALLLVVDEVDDHPDLVRTIAEELDQEETHLILVPGSIDDWFRPVQGDGQGPSVSADLINLDELINRHPIAKEFLSTVVKLAREIKASRS